MENCCDLGKVEQKLLLCIMEALWSSVDSENFQGWWLVNRS